MFNFDSIYLVYLLIGVSAAMFAEGLYLLVFNNASYRKNINRRLKVMDGKTDRESVLVQLRRERGLTSSGDYRLPLVSLNKLLLQSGLTIGFGRLILFIVIGATATFAAMITFEGNAFHAILATLFSGLVLPPFVLRILRNRRQKKFSAQFPDGIDIIVRSLRAGHPVPIAIAMVSKEMPDPIGTEFGMVSDELTYGPTSRPRCATCFSALERMTCPCSSRLWLFSDQRAATLAKFSKTCHPLFVNASRCGEKFGPWPRKAVLRH
jgi:tight adherence protein B